jgi:hypothetical protein
MKTIDYFLSLHSIKTIDLSFFILQVKAENSRPVNKGILTRSLFLLILIDETNKNNNMIILIHSINNNKRNNIMSIIKKAFEITILLKLSSLRSHPLKMRAFVLLCTYESQVVEVHGANNRSPCNLHASGVFRSVYDASWTKQNRCFWDFYYLSSIYNMCDLKQPHLNAYVTTINLIA